MASVRVGLTRFVAMLLVTAQAGAFAFAPYLEARQRTPAELAPTIEAGHGADCVVLHRPDHCLACQLLSLRYRGAPAVAFVPAAATSAVAPFQVRTALPPHAAPASLHNSRGPPLVTA